MKIGTVGVMSPGDMGSGVGGALIQNGIRVITDLNGRSDESKQRAIGHGFEDVGSLDELVNQSDLVLSILVPSEALTFAANLAEALTRTGSCVTVADCNAVSPNTAAKISEVITDAGGKFVDAGIIGGSPRRGATPRFYASGTHASVLGELDGKGISVPVMDGPVGTASGLKMVYAALTKGTAALYASTLMTAKSLGLFKDLIAELELSQVTTLSEMERVKSVSAQAFRWVGEMEEIADTFSAAGTTSHIHIGAAETFQMIADSSIGHERVGTVDNSRTLEDSIAAMLLSSN
ncbi:MAG: NAD(P)-dependent oxidoreductase [SAR202 cluster bacterium]|nr:NAD(P)-dependent oxidoreductase [SAR202 cluster bacterium]|tara:strand:- start:1391 stop:2266 length:876 start_codon:yes stop_codon:yes gene_type:complete